MLRRRHERRRRLFPRAIVVGLCAGLVASFFRAGVERGEEMRGERELRAGDRLQVVIAPEAADAVGLLRVGVGLDRHAGD